MGELFTPMRSTSRYTQLGISAFVIVLIIIYHSGFLFSDTQAQSGSVRSAPGNQRLYGREYGGRSSPDINRVTNETLGFSNVFVVGLPDRSDKRDAIVLTSAATGFRVEFVDGIKGETIPDKAVPFGVERKALMESNLGSWRGHMNAIRR